MTRRPPNVLWTGSEAIVNAAMQMISAFVIARMIGPSEVGVAAVAIASHFMLQSMLGGLGQTTMVQLPDMPDATASSYFWLVSGVSLVAAIAFAIAGLPLEHVVDDSRTPLMCLALAPTLLLAGPAGVIHGMMVRRRQFKSIAIRTVVGQVCGVGVGVVMALRGWGAWSLVAVRGVSIVTGIAALVVYSDWKPSRVFAYAPTKAILRVAIPLSVNAVVVIARYRVFTLIIGGLLGPFVMGQVHIAFQLIDTGRELLIVAVTRLMVPGFAVRRDDRGKTLDYYRRCAALVAATGAPLFGALYLVMRPSVRWFMGDVWMPVVPAAQALAVLSVWTLALSPAQSLQIASSRTRAILFAGTASFAVLMAVMLVAAPHTPLEAACVWIVAAIVPLVISVWRAALIVETSGWPIVSPVVLPIAIAAAATALGALIHPYVAPYGAVVGLAVTLGAFAVVLGLGYAVLLRRTLAQALSALVPSRAPRSSPQP